MFIQYQVVGRDRCGCICDHCGFNSGDLGRGQRPKMTIITVVAKVSMIERGKSALPGCLKRAIRQALLDPFKRRLMDLRLKQLVRKFRSSPMPNRDLIVELRRAWGNEGWSADVTYLSEAANRVGRCTTDVLDCGSGLTTLVAALVGERRNLTIWSLEQDPEWADLVNRRLRQNGIRNVVLRHAPLRDFGGYVWYDTSTSDWPRHFDLILCDGPAVRKRKWGESHSQWRYGVLPVLSRSGIGVTEILLDDATEPRAANLLSRWETEFGMSHRMIRTVDGDCAIVKPSCDSSVTSAHESGT